MIDRIREEIETNGYKMGIASISHLEDLRHEYESRHDHQYDEADFYGTVRGFFRFSVPEVTYGSTKSIISIAAPSPQVRLFFNWRGKRLPVLLPPAYMEYGAELTKIEKHLTEVTARYGYHVTRASLPEKLLTVQSGLGLYGRNNICYVPGLGSFVFLASFYSDLPLEEDTWREMQLMQSCENCKACLHRCPTGAITGDRVLLKTERCLTYQNEFIDPAPFPAWIDPEAHHCLIGCMHCQTICPQNKEFLNRVVEPAEFSEEETALLMEGKTEFNCLPITLACKLEQLHLVDYYVLLPRNLRVLVHEW